MQVSVESPTKLERRVTVVVPVEKWDEAFDKRISKLAKTAKVKGFRPGNVPLTYVKQMYGDAARQEALSDVIQSSLYAAMQQEKLNPVGTPSVEPKSIVPGQPIEFVAVFEVLPKIEAVNFAVSTLEKQVATITEADIDTVIGRLCEQHTKWKQVDRAAREKDQVVIDFRGSLDGKVFAGGEAHDYPVIIGSKSMIPGFEEGIIGIKAGEEKTIKVTFPENYFSKDLAGKEAEFAIHAHKVSEPEVPEVNADLVKKFGVKSGDVNDLRTEIRNNLEREVTRIIKNKLKTKVFDALLEQNALEIPKALITQEANRIHHEMHPHHGNEGHDHTEEEMAQFNEAAARNVALGLLISEYVKQHKITPDQARVQSQLTQIAAAYENPAEVVQWYTSDKRRLAEIEAFILEEQVMDKLLEGVTVAEKTLGYQDLINS
jgi:trigger factor